MKPLAKKIIVFLVLFVLGYFVGKQIAKAQPPAPTHTLLYEISGKGLKQPSYLYGTFHVLCNDDLLLTETIKDKLNASEQLVLELDMDAPDFMAKMQTNMMLNNDKTLKNYLSESEYASVNQFFKDSLKMPLEQMISIKPFMLSTMLYPKYLGCTPASWEMTLVQLAQEKKMEVLGLETVEEQMKVLNALPYEQQAKVLLEGIKEYQKSKSLFLNMLTLYKTQNIEEMYKISKEYFDEEMQGLEKTMLADRNHNWIPKIGKLSKEKATFYAVGAGHLGGEAGVIALLKKEGYTVKSIENKVDMKVTKSNTANPQNEVAKLLIRQWKPESSMIPQMVEDVIENVRKQNAEQAKQIEAQKEILAQVLSNMITEYKSDNTFEITIPNSPQSGTWKLSEDNKQIIRIDENGKESINEIVEISDKKLVVLNSEKKKIVYVAL
jgi:uncharacterized protein YbaP (TraB family)